MSDSTQIKENNPILFARVHLAIIDVMKEVGAIGKNGRNASQNYKFRNIDDVYNALSPALSKCGVFFAPEVLSKDESRDGNRIRVCLTVKYRVYASDGSFIEVTVAGEGIDSSDKATNKAFTAAWKYLVFQLFCIAVEEQEDADKESPPLPKLDVKKALKDEQAKIRSAPKSPGDYVFTFGQKYKGKKLSSIKVDEIIEYLDWIEGKLKADNKSASSEVQEFIDSANFYIEEQMDKEGKK